MNTILMIFIICCISTAFVSSSNIRKATKPATDPFDPSNDEDPNAASDSLNDDDKEEKEFEKNVRIAKEDLHIKKLASHAAVEAVKYYRSDDTKMRNAKLNYTTAMENENEVKEQLDEFNATFVEAEKELKIAKNISTKAILDESVLTKQSKNANITYKLTLANVTNLRTAQGQSKIHLKEVELSDAKRQAAKRLKVALEKVKALKKVGAGHEAFEELRQELTAIKEHKKKKDMDHEAIFDAIKKAKEDAIRVKQLRKELDEAEEKAHEAKDKMDNITKSGELPEDYVPGDIPSEFESKTSTIEQWINALDLPGKSKLKNETAKKLWSYRATKYKNALMMLNETTTSELYARNNFTETEQKYFNATLEAMHAKHNFDIRRAAFYAERTFDMTTMKEHVRGTDIAARLAKEKVDRMLKAEKVMRETAKKTEDAVRALHKSLETHAAFMKIALRKPYVPPRLENGHGIDGMETVNSPLAEAAKDLVWGDVKSAEEAVHSIIHKIQSRANETAVLAVAKGPNVLGAQAGKAFKNHAVMKALQNIANNARFREFVPGSDSKTQKAKTGWVIPSVNDNSYKAKIKAHSSHGKHHQHSHSHHHHHHHHQNLATAARFQSAGESLTVASKKATSSLRGKLVTVATTGMDNKNSKNSKQEQQSPQMVPPLKAQPSHCFDGKRDNGEAGVDCGGTCARQCGFHRVKMVKSSNKDEYHKVSMFPHNMKGDTPQIVRKLECGKGADCSKAKDFLPVHYTDVDGGKK